MCWTLDIQFIHSSFHSTMLNVALVPAARRCLFTVIISVQMQSGDLSSGNGEQTNYNLLLEGGGNREGLIQLEIRVHWESCLIHRIH